MGLSTGPSLVPLFTYDESERCSFGLNPASPCRASCSVRKQTAEDEGQDMVASRLSGGSVSGCPSPLIGPKDAGW